jgi:hypothetical protein
MCQAYAAAGEIPEPNIRALAYDKIWLDGCTGKSSRVEKMTLPLFTLRTLEGLDPYIDLAIIRWRDKKLRAYPGGVGEVLDKWGKPWTGSPFAQYLWGVV